MQRDKSSNQFPLGSELPDFELLNVDGRRVSSQYLTSGKVGMVIFTCNHCPYVKGSEAILSSIVKKFSPLGLKTVGINSNDPLQYPEDSYENMQRKAAQFDLPYPYLFDETQQVARLFDAACTPEIYLFDSNKKLAFHGTINDNPRNQEQAKVEFLSRAIQQIIDGQSVEPAFVHPIGCSIKWKLGTN